jgi:hemerythrin-like domain-containing protein
MDINKLMAVMNGVQEDHAQVLEKLQALREALASLAEPDRSPQSVLRWLHEVNTSFGKRFAEHAAEEEKTLFPFLTENLPDEPNLVASLRQEHVQIRKKFADFASCMDVGEEVDGPPRAILLDVLSFGWELLDLLDRHASSVTRAVQQCFSRFVRSVPGM